MIVTGTPAAEEDDQSSVHIGRHLRWLRKQRHLTQQQVAHLAGLTRNTVGDLERERFPDPHLHVLLKLMQAYQLGSLEELLGPVPTARLTTHWEHAGWSGTRHAAQDTAGDHPAPPGGETPKA